MDDKIVVDAAWSDWNRKLLQDLLDRIKRLEDQLAGISNAKPVRFTPIEPGAPERP